MTQPTRPHLPIGYWLRKADELLTTRINAAQHATGLTRTDWQVLNVLNEEASVGREHLAELLHPFAGPAALAAVLMGLGRRGLIEGGDGAAESYRITDAGRGLHDSALRVQMALRKQAISGVTDDDYATTLRVLQQIVHNLEETSHP